MSPPLLINIAAAYHQLPDGAKLRYAVFEPKGAPHGTVLMLQGRREFIEKKYLEAGKDFETRGFRVIALDWRGQGLSTRYFGGAGRQRDHAIDFDLYNADLSSFCRDVVAARTIGPLFLFAHSMGALIASRWLAQGGGTSLPALAGIIFTTPALAIGVPSFSGMITSVGLRLGFAEHYTIGQHDYDDSDRRFAGNVLSHDRERFAVIENYFDGNPELKVGGVTWGWLHAALKAAKELKQEGVMERITLPALGVFAARDIVTPPPKTIPIFRRMPKAEAVTIPGAFHDLMNEADRYRDQAWKRIDDFLRRFTRAKS
jgi:lysophospholipase